jgi:hypothetical protein
MWGNTLTVKKISGENLVAVQVPVIKQHIMLENLNLLFA